MDKSGPKIYSEEYYETLKSIAGNHWWTLGMDDIMDIIILPNMPDNCDKHIIDMGCGSGTGLVWAKSRFPEGSYILGIDISQHGIKRCKNRGADLLVGSVTNVPISSNSFDLAICNDVLQHVEDDQKVVMEANRILKPGGVLFIRTNSKFVLPKLPGCLRLYKKHGLRELLRNTGFDEIIISHANLPGSLISIMKYYLQSDSSDYNDKQIDVCGHNHDGKKNKGGLMIQARSTGGKSMMERLMRLTLQMEGRLMRLLPWLIPFGHTHIVLAKKPK